MTTRRDLLAGLGAGAFLSSLPLRASAAGDRLSVVATTGMIADAARAVGGDLVEVKALMGPGVDPHAYRQTRTDILAMTRADLVLWNGLYLEAQMEEFFENLSRRVPVVPVAEAVPADVLVAHDDYQNRFDPHVWMDPSLWVDAVGAISTALDTNGVADQDALIAQTALYMEELARIGSYATEVLATVPEEARVLVTAHDAFNYFGRAYGFEVVGIQGISTESEAGVNRISQLVGMIVERGIAAVFVESSVSDRSIRALQEGARAKGHDLKIGGELFSDAMGEPGTYEGTYIGMIDHNATTIARALGGTAPERGRYGQLSAGS